MDLAPWGEFLRSTKKYSFVLFVYCLCRFVRLVFPPTFYSYIVQSFPINNLHLYCIKFSHLQFTLILPKGFLCYILSYIVQSFPHLHFTPILYKGGFGGLGVACWPLVPKFGGSNPTKAVGFLGRKNSQHAFLRRGSKAVGPMS